MLKDRVSALREANIYEPQRYRHLVSSIRIVGEAAAMLDLVANFLVVRTMQDGEMTIFAAGHYVDRVRQDGDDWKFAAQERHSRQPPDRHPAGDPDLADGAAACRFSSSGAAAWRWR